LSFAQNTRPDPTLFANWADTRQATHRMSLSLS
jgi:hypothetical protein